ncbi:MAG: FAD-binding oxidoreductase [bacterium]
MSRDLPEKADVVVIGGGIIGVSVAYYLGMKGVGEVLLLERGMMGQGSTGKCAGGIRSQFSTDINVRFSLLSRSVFDSFQESFGVDPEFHRVGYLFLASQAAHWAQLKGNARLLESHKVALELLEPGEIAGRWPFLEVADLLGGSYSADDGYAGPYEVLQGFARGARRLGVKLVEGVEVTSIRVSRGRVSGVQTSQGCFVATSWVVNAAGPQAAMVASMAGLDLPVKPYRRQLFFTDPFDDLPGQFPLIIDLGLGWYMRREGRGLLLSGPQDEQSSFNENVDFDSKEWTAERSLHRCPVLEKARIARGWAGLYEVSPDHHAIIGEFPELRGFLCVNGFSGHGFQHSPAAGMVAAEIIAEGRATSIDIYPLRPTRFREGDLIHEPLTAIRD